MQTGDPLPSADALELAELRERQQWLEMAIAGSGTGIWDRNVVTGEIRYSKGWKALLGYDEDELSNRIEDSYLRLHPDDLGYVKAAMQDHFEGRTEYYEVEHRIRCKDGSYKWICSRGKVMSRDSEGRALRMVGTTTDITERKRIEAELKEYATTDGLTRLANRRHFMTRLEAHFAYLRRAASSPASILMFDLDHFKTINDRWGHAVGDKALCHFAGILLMELRTTDIAGRLGGEEFAVLLTLSDLKGACVVAQRVQQRLMAQPLTHVEEVVPLTVSIGATAISLADDTPGAVLTRSDQALYLAKKNGRNRVECA